jgi:cyanophycinase
MPGAKHVTPGPLALVGGDELSPGNEPQDRVLVQAAGGGPAFVLATAAARHRPDLAVENARRWFGGLGLDVEELSATKRSHVGSAEMAERARAGRFFYLIGGDPGIVPSLLAGSAVWRAIVDAWRDGAALGGSSAGAMALGEWTLVRERMPGDHRRRYVDALGLVPNVAVLPHFDTFGDRWVESAQAAAPRDDVVLVGPDERTAAVWRDGEWTVLGAGGVTIISGGRRVTFPAGSPIVGVPSPRTR